MCLEMDLVWSPFFLRSSSGAYVSGKETQATPWIKPQAVDVAQKHHLQVEYSEMNAPAIGPTRLCQIALIKGAAGPGLSFLVTDLPMAGPRNGISE